MELPDRIAADERLATSRNWVRLQRASAALERELLADTRCQVKPEHQVLVGGVNSPVRAFRSVGGTPVFMKSGKGAHVTDADGKTYIDYCLSWGPLILGHAHPAVLRAAIDTTKSGSSFGASTTSLPTDRRFWPPTTGATSIPSPSVMPPRRCIGRCGFWPRLNCSTFRHWPRCWRRSV